MVAENKIVIMIGYNFCCSWNCDTSIIVYKWGFICKNLAFLAVNYMFPIQISRVGTP